MKIKKSYWAAVLVGSLALLFSPCLIKLISGYPCPACGTRRAMIEALKGNISDSVYINPYGILFLVLGLFFSIGYLYDRITGGRDFRFFCQRVKCLIANRYVLFLVVLLTILNWISNIQKGI